MQQLHRPVQTPHWLTDQIACFSLPRNEQEARMASDDTVGDPVAEFLTRCGVTTTFGIASVHNANQRA